MSPSVPLIGEPADKSPSLRFCGIAFAHRRA
jgi:hypothetical protein